jgi:hypothetical protein
MTRGFPPKLVPPELCEFSGCRDGSSPCSEHRIRHWTYEIAATDASPPTALQRLQEMQR